jgi:glycosyltransferase involved in cell wall biosynthesis
MKVLNVNVILDPVLGGGTAERTFQMSKAFYDAGVECTILTTDVGLTEPRVEALKGIPVIALHCIFKRFFVVSFSIFKLKRLIESVDIVHLMGHWNVLNVIVYLITRITKTPYVICPAGELNIFGRSVLLKNIFNVLIGKKIIRDASGYVAVTNDEVLLFKKCNVDEKKVIVVPNGVSPKDFIQKVTGSQSTKINTQGAPYILFMGRLNLIKGPDLLLHAFINISLKFPEYHLVFAGPDGGMLEQLEKLAHQSSVSNRIHFVGYINGLDKVTAYSDADLLVIPSRHEAMSIVVLESGMVKTPVLITNQCGFDIIEDKSGGLVVEANISAIQAGLSIALGEKEKLHSMGEHLHQFVIQNYTWDIIARKYLLFFQSVVNNKKHSRTK